MLYALMKVLGFSQTKRLILLKFWWGYVLVMVIGLIEMFVVNMIWWINYRYGVSDYDWIEFASRIQQKSYEEIDEY